MTFSKFVVAAAALAGSTFAQSGTTEPQFDVAAIAAAGPPPEPSIAINVPSQTVHFDAVAVEHSAAAEQSAAAQDSGSSKVKRAACDPQILGKGPVPSPDTDQAF